MSDLRRLFLSLFAAAILAACLAIPSFGSEASSGPVRHTIAGAHVAIYNLVGTLEVVRGDGPSVVAEVSTRGEDASQLKVASGVIDGVQTFRIVYPGNRILVREFGDHTTSTFRVREDGTFGGKDHTGRKVTLTGHGSGVEAAADVRIRVPAGKKVDIYWGHGVGSVTRVEADLSLDAAAMPISVTGIRGPLSVDVGSGEVKIDDAVGDVAVDTGSGEVSLSGIRAETIDVDTGSGEVTGTRLTSTTLSIDTGSGEIQVTGLKVQRLSLETGSGGVVAELSEGVQSVEIESGSGDVSVTIPKKFGAQIAVETGSGGIETNLTMETSIRKHDELVGRIGDGSGQISIETGSGTVSIRQAGL